MPAAASATSGATSGGNAQTKGADSRTDEESKNDNVHLGDEEVVSFQTRAENYALRKQAEEDELAVGGDSNAPAMRGLAIKPFIAPCSLPPTKAPQVDRSAPKSGLELEFVHGYRCHDSRNNLVFNSKGNIVYPAAALVITMDCSSREQRFFTGHDDDVLCLAQSPADPDIVATGQIATVEAGKTKLPSICVHNTVTQEKWIIKSAGERAISAVGFSGDGSLLAAAAGDDKYTVSVYDWKKGEKLATLQSGAKSSILQLVWNCNNSEFVTVGANMISFWTFEKGTLKMKSGLDNVPKQIYTCAAYSLTGNQTLVGAQDGGVYVFVRGVPKKVFRVHASKVNSVAQQGKHFVTGGDDKRVCVLNSSLQPVWQAEFQYQVRSVRSNEAGDLVIGTRGSEVFNIPFELQQPHGSCVNYQQLPPPVIRGHFDGEVWGVVPHPKLPQFASVGEDNQVITWDVDKKRAIAVGPLATEKGKYVKINKASTTSNFPINQMGRAIDYSPDGSVIAIGSNEGHLLVCDASTLKIVKNIDLNNSGKRQVTTQNQNWIEVVRFSPTGNTLAVGTHGICIVLLNVANNYSVDHIIKEHTAAPLALDWSADGTYMRSISLSYELLFHHINEKNLQATKHETSATIVRDVFWHTVTVKFAWEVLGIWRKSDGSEEVEYCNINSADANASRTLLACGTNEGLVNLFRYPAAKKGPTDKPENGFRAHKGHSSHVPRVRFDYAEKHLFSSGGEDKCVFQWKVVKASA